MHSVSQVSGKIPEQNFKSLSLSLYIHMVVQCQLTLGLPAHVMDFLGKNSCWKLLLNPQDREHPAAVLQILLKSWILKFWPSKINWSILVILSNMYVCSQTHQLLLIGYSNQINNRKSFWRICGFQKFISPLFFTVFQPYLASMSYKCSSVTSRSYFVLN